MRNVLYFLFLALFFTACSSTKEIQMGQLTQEPCKNETKLTDQRSFTGETVDNLNIFQQGDNVLATMDVRTTCNARLSFEPKQEKDDVIVLKLRNATGSGDCVCVTKVSTSFSNPGKGEYKVRVMSSNNELLAEQPASIR